MAQTQTTTIGALLEKFNNDQLLLAIETEGYECERLQADKEAEATEQASAKVLHEGATQEPKVEDVTRPDQEI